MHLDSGTIAVVLAVVSAIYYAGRTTKLLEVLVEDVTLLKRRVDQIEKSKTGPQQVFAKGAGAD